MGIDKIMTLTPHGPHIRKCEATDPHSCLSQGTYLSNKHTHFKEIRGGVAANNNWIKLMYI